MLPWGRSPIRTVEEARETLNRLDDVAGTGLRSTLADLEALNARVGLRRPADLAGWQGFLKLINDVAETLRLFRPEVFDDVDRLHHATADRAWRSRQSHRMGFRQRRSLLKKARALTLDGRRDRSGLHRALARALEQRDQWRRLSERGLLPSIVGGLAGLLEGATRRYRRLRDDLATIMEGAGLNDAYLRWRPDAVQQALDELSAGRDELHRIHQINQHTNRFEAFGLVPDLPAVEPVPG